MERDHPLAKWLRIKSLTFEAAAVLFGVANGSVVYRYAHQGRIPRPDVMARIVVATGGELGPADFYQALMPLQSADTPSVHADTIAETPGSTSEAA